MIFTNGNFIKIDESRCLSLMRLGVECSHCVGHCPAHAIGFNNNRIILNKDQCNGCGLCFSDCPTQVFSSQQWDETTILQDIELGEWKVTELFCAIHTLPYQVAKNKDRGALQLPACLSAISKGAWYELGLKTEVEIHLDQCSECPNFETISRLEYNVKTAAEWLEASGHAPAISYLHQGSQVKTKKNLLANETGLRVTSRRDFFISIINKGREQLGNAPEEAENSPKKLNNKTRNNCLPDWQKRLAAVFQKNMIEGSTPAYWPTITISNHCVHCGLCSRNCPSGTLQTVVKDGVCTHYFTSGLCLDCRMCQLLCPKEAISRNRQKVEKPFEVSNIYSTSSKECRRCGGTTVDSSEDLCYWCKLEETVDNEMISSFKKMLLSR
jgi:Fe-S-cluster-containing hydrogenase component 2